VDFSLDPGTFRQQLRTLLRERWIVEFGGGTRTGVAGEQALAGWRALLRETGLLMPAWPQRYGGVGLGPERQLILLEEFAAADAPSGSRHDKMGALVGQLLIDSGSEEQRQYFLPRMLDGVDTWCQGFSEPEAGSDLAGIRCRAELTGQRWRVNGQKIWTSQGHLADWMMLLARSDPQAARHRGITLLLLPMNQEGVEVRPIKMITGASEFCEVYFTDATTDAANVVGEVNGGWSVAMTLMRYSRGGDMLVRHPRQFRAAFDRLWRVARDTGAAEDPVIRDRLADCYVKVEVMRALAARVAGAQGKGRLHDVGASIFKLYWSEYHQAAADLALDILGEAAATPEGHWPVQWSADAGPASTVAVGEAGTGGDTGSWIGDYLVARGSTIYGGTSQVQRTVIGELGLGLPKEPVPSPPPQKEGRPS
jgi:alkylation response protein AidB-like acyl-CoA dehydrogenase